MSEEQPPAPPEGPDLHVVGKMPPRKHRTAPVSLEQYEMLAKAYLRGARSIRTLRKETGFGLDTCAKAINVGWPERQWPSLKERAEIHDRRLREKTDEPMTSQQMVDVARFQMMRNENLNLARALRSLALRMASRINAAIETAVMTRRAKQTRVIDVPHGKRVVQRVVQEDVDLPPSLPQLAAAARDLGSLAATAGDAERVWARVEPPADAAGKVVGFAELTDEQLDFIIKNQGRLPDGVTPEMIRG